MAAGSIVIDLLMKTGSFETDSKRAEARLRAFEKEAKRVGKVIGTAIATGATVAVTALAAMTKAAIDNADSMRDMSIRLGVDIELLSAYGYAASQTGTDLEVMGKGLKTLAKNAADGLNPTSEYFKVFDALGIKVTDSEGKLRDLGELVPEIADKFQQLEDGTTKAALAQSLFGRAGLEMTEFLNQGAAGITDLTDRARELGLVVDAETGAAADDFNDTLGDLKAISQGYALHLAEELLPDLQALADSFSNTATEGDKVKEMAQDTADFLRGLATVAHFVSSAFELVGTGIATLHAQGQALGEFLFRDMSRGMAMYQAASQGFTDELDEAFGTGSKGPSKDPRFASVTGGASTVAVSDGDLARRLAVALSNPTATTGGKKGKSDAEKEAEQLQQQYDEMVASLHQQIALVGDVTELEAFRYELANGELSKLDPLQKEQLETLAETLAIKKEEIEAQRKFDEENKAQSKQREDVLKALHEEIELVGLSADQQEIWNNLKWAGVGAESAWGQQIIETTEELQRQRDLVFEEIDAMDGLRDAAKGFLSDLREGKGVWDSLSDAADNFASILFDIAAQGLIDQLFGKQGDTAGGSAGDWVSGLLGMFGFGGAKAGGGDVMPRNAYLVGEDGPEMFVPRTAGLILPAAQTSMAGAGGGVTQANYFQFAAPTDPRTQTQLAAKAGAATQRALSRNN